VRRRFALMTMAVVGAVVGLLPACGSNLQFRADHRVHVIAPHARSVVQTPLTVRWTYRDFTVTGPDGGHDPRRGYFGVFVDRSPMPAGNDLRWFARNDRSCRAVDGCPDADYLGRRRILTTTSPRVTVDQLDVPPYHRGLEDHTVVIVLLDGQGRRVGESAWYVDFRVRSRK